MKTCNQLKAEAVKILLDETFSCIDRNMHEAYITIAQKNSQLRNVTGNFFLYHGEVYPKRTANGTSIAGLRVTTTPLHYSLIEEIDRVNSLKEAANHTAIKNYFSAVMGASFHDLVLETLLPAVLVNRLKKEFSPEEYKAVSLGAFPMSKPTIPVEEVKAFIAQIKTHYETTIVCLRRLLMNNLLLQE